MPSAYAAFNGVEPEYTNHCVSGMNPQPFTGTLDYIFYSAGQCVRCVWNESAISNHARLRFTYISDARMADYIHTQP